MMVNTLVIYDIVEDKARNKVGEVCKDYGLERIQWSAFFGLTDRNRRGEMMIKFRHILGKTDGVIHMYVICDKDLRLRKEIKVQGSGKKPAVTARRESEASESIPVQ